MAEVLSFPFRLAPNGRLATVQQGTVRASEEALAHIIQTRKAERTYVPVFGIDDPTWQGVDEAEIRTQWRLYGDGRLIDRVQVAAIDANTQRVTVEMRP